MTSEQSVRVFNLNAFIEAFWVPAIEGVADVQSASVHETAKWIEAVEWLQLGTELGFYPEREGTKLLQDHRKTLASLITRHLHSLQTIVPPRLLDNLPILLSSGGTRIRIDSYSEADAGDLLGSFQSALGVAYELGLDILAAEFQQAITSLKANRFVQLFHRTVSPSLVADFYSGTEISESCAEKWAAFLRTVDGMLLWQEWFENLRLDTEVNPGARQSLLRRVGQITCWRLNLNDEFLRARFQAAAEIVSDVVSEIAREARLPLPKDVPFIQAIQSIIDNWLTDHPFQLTAGKAAAPA